jgi:hypothetical protein
VRDAGKPTEEGAMAKMSVTVVRTEVTPKVAMRRCGMLAPRVSSCMYT